MMNCPKCNTQLGWLGDHDLDDELYATQYVCRNEGCHIEVWEYWGEGVEREFEGEEQ